jgi:aspartyl-tRNA(Asn)/glutamyl-tRNA(Gln) amidotransferase subunit A
MIPKDLIDNPEARRDVSAVKAAELFLARIAERTPAVRAVVTPTPDLAFADALRVDQARRQGAPLPLDGMAIVLKDNIDVGGVPSASGSLLLGKEPAVRDSRVAERLRAAGGVIVGKAQSTELMFALASNPRSTSALNPWDRKRIAGASSSGSGSALADDQCIGAIGTDTGGSVRIPAAFSGVSALRPTFGLVSTTGVFPLSRSFDAVGPMARSADDVAKLFEVLVGFDPSDSRSIPVRPVDLPPGSSLRIGVPTNFFFDQCDAEIAAAVHQAARRLEQLGHTLVRIDVPLVSAAQQGFTEFLWSEAFALHRERLATHSDRMSVDIRKRLRFGSKVTTSRLVEIIETMHAWRQQLRTIFADQAHILLTPTVECLPPLDADARVGRMPGVTRLTYPWSFGHLPAMSIPCGFTNSGLPIGLQLAAAPFEDRRLLALAKQYQSVTDWHLRRPAQQTAHE